MAQSSHCGHTIRPSPPFAPEASPCPLHYKMVKTGASLGDRVRQWPD